MTSPARKGEEKISSPEIYGMAMNRNGIMATQAKETYRFGSKEKLTAILSPKMSSRQHNNMSTKLIDITKQIPSNTLNRSMSEAVWDLNTAASK